jgi:hypothetical protein
MLEQRESIDYNYVCSCSDWPLEPIGTFALSMGLPCPLVPSTGAVSAHLDRAAHSWRLRPTLLSLLRAPPPHLHCAVFPRRPELSREPECFERAHRVLVAELG